MPKDYFSLQNACDAEGKGNEHERGADTGAMSVLGHKQLTPAVLIRRISTEGSTSMGKCGEPYPGKSLTVQIVLCNSETLPEAKSKPKPGVSKMHANGNDEDMGEEEANDTSMIIDTPVTSTSCGGPR